MRNIKFIVGLTLVLIAAMTYAGVPIFISIVLGMMILKIALLITIKKN